MPTDKMVSLVRDIEVCFDEASRHEMELAKVPPPTGMTEFFGLEPEHMKRRREELLAAEPALRDKCVEARERLQQHLEGLGCRPAELESVVANISKAMQSRRNDANSANDAKAWMRDFCFKVEAAHDATYDTWARERLIRMAGEELAASTGLNVKTHIR